MVVLLLGACAGVRADKAEGLVLNEVLAVNEASNSDEAEQFDDWLEIHNGGAVAVSLADLYLSDDAAAPGRWPLPADETLAPGAFLLVWCDGELEQGPLHAPFKLSGGGETVVLSYVRDDDTTLLDQVEFGEQLADTAWARLPDGGIEWAAAAPTPGASNAE
jgi:hypothetical protein